MAPLSYRRHRFPAEIIQHAIWLYVRFTLSYRDVEELLAERGLDISYETVRRWVPCHRANYSPRYRGYNLWYIRAPTRLWALSHRPRQVNVTMPTAPFGRGSRRRSY